MSAAPQLESTTAPVVAEAEEKEKKVESEEELVPVIPQCTAHKFYKPPPFLRGLRPKRKVAIVFGYIGERYCGLQWNKNPAYPTVEEALLKALYETDMISLSNMATVKVQQRLDFERASRTDKGVHALRNVVSMNVMLPYDPAYVSRKEEELLLLSSRAEPDAPSVEDTAAASAAAKGQDGEGGDDRFSYAEAKRLLNTALPRDIHVYEVVPVTRSFNAYLSCGWRRYEYYLPTFCLMSRKEYSEEHFPASLAPAKPSLADIGVPLNPEHATAAADTGGRFTKVQEDGAGSCAKDDDDEDADDGGRGERGRGEGRGRGGDNGYGRKSRGHFPMRKGKKQRREAEAAEARKAEGDETKQQQLEEEGQQHNAKQQREKEDREPRLPPDQTSATHFHDGIFEHMILFRSIPEDAMRAIAANYRLSSTQLQAVRGYFKQYEGTHWYHNFTPGGRGNDPSCSRYMKSITVTEPFVVYPDGEDSDEDTADGPGDSAAPTETRVSSTLIQESVKYWSPSRFFSPDEKVMQDYAAMAADIQPQQQTGKEEENADDEDEKANALRASILRRMQRVYGRERGTATDNKDSSAEGGGQRRGAGGGIEVVRIEIEGQSFLLNQIRKMIGAVICCCATDSPADTIPAHLLNRQERRGIPMAPANGLFLSYLDFARYNIRLDRIRSNGATVGSKVGLELERVEPRELMEWRAKTVAVVLRNEMAEDICGKWMRSLRCVLRLAWDTELP